MDLNSVVWGMQLVWWLVIGLVLVALVVLVFSVLPVVRRLPGLRHGGVRLRRHLAAAQALQKRTVELQQRMTGLAGQAGRAQARIAEINRRRKAT